MIRIGVRSFVAAVSGGGTDADAQAFIDAAGITDATQQSAINTLVTDLKGYSIWDKMKAIYPFVGGTATTHKWNLKNPTDSDAAYRLVFSGGWTHSSTGAIPNGTNGYADSKLNLSTKTTLYDVAYSIYIRTSSTQGIDMGCTTSSGGYLSEGWMSSSYLGNAQGGFYDNDRGSCGTFASTYGGVKCPNADSKGFYVSSITSTTNSFLSKNNSVVATCTGIINTTPANTEVVIGAAKDATTNTIIEYSNKEFSFASISDGLTNTEAANFYTAVQAYQTTLSRNV